MERPGQQAPGRSEAAIIAQGLLQAVCETGPGLPRQELPGLGAAETGAVDTTGPAVFVADAGVGMGQALHELGQLVEAAFAATADIDGFVVAMR